MKLPRYLVIALFLTGCAVVASEFFTTDDISTPVAAPLKVRPVPEKKASVEELTDFVDLFPSGLRHVVAAEVVRPVIPVPQEPAFPYLVVGAWWQKGERIVIISNGNHDRLICQRCGVKDAIHPGSAVTPEWRLIKIADDAMTVEWEPQKLLKHIELGDLKSAPIR
ncbi:hypothetical protein [Pantoea endophytica]|uniref:hypothetical protein n=1 Tax=Pantoea endophytica TaxID=92488 RepID=UPI0030161551